MKPISFKIFSIFYYLMIAWFAVSSLLEFAGYYFLLLLLFSLVAVGWTGCYFLIGNAIRHHPVAPANDEEIGKEDDVLLQGITFVSAVLFFYVNTLISDVKNKFWISLMIFLATGSFFFFRAIAKIKSNRFYRLLSVFFLFWVAGSYALEFVVIFFPTIFPFILTLPILVFVLILVGLSVLFFLLVSLAIVFFAQRYGFRTRLRR